MVGPSRVTVHDEGDHFGSNLTCYFYCPRQEPCTEIFWFDAIDIVTCTVCFFVRKTKNSKIVAAATV